MYAATTAARATLVERDDHLLTQEEFRQHAPAVAAAIKEELQIWLDHDCFCRTPRKTASNILDCRWVGKWKRTKAKDDPTKTVWVIRMRLTLRGFKDRGAAYLDT